MIRHQLSSISRTSLGYSTVSKNSNNRIFLWLSLSLADSRAKRSNQLLQSRCVIISWCKFWTLRGTRFAGPYFLFWIKLITQKRRNRSKKWRSTGVPSKNGRKTHDKTFFVHEIINKEICRLFDDSSQQLYTKYYNSTK